MGMITFLWIVGLMAFIILVVAIITHDYTKDEKGKGIEEKMDDHLLNILIDSLRFRW